MFYWDMYLCLQCSVGVHRNVCLVVLLQLRHYSFAQKRCFCIVSMHLSYVHVLLTRKEQIKYLLSNLSLGGLCVSLYTVLTRALLS